MYTMGIYDEDPNYSTRLAVALTKRKNLPYEVVAFTGEEGLMQYAKHQKIELLIMPEHLLTDKIKTLSIQYYMWLSEIKRKNETLEPTIFKYQSVESIQEEIMVYDRLIHEDENLYETGRRARIIGVFAPAGGVFASKLAEEVAHGLEEQGKTLFWCLDEYMYEKYEYENPRDLADVYYYYTQDRFNTKARSCVYRHRGLARVLPVQNADNLRDMQGNIVAKMLEEAAAHLGYMYFVVDIGHAIPENSAILSCCDHLLVPKWAYEEEVNKYKSFFAYLKNQTSIKMDKLQIVSWPESWKNNISEAEWKKQVRKLVEV